MNTPKAERILEVLKQLCLIPSVSGCAKEENRCAQFLYDFLKKLEAPSEGRLSVELVPCEGDPLQRNAVLALLKAPKPTDRTVILTGHFDVVDSAACGDLAETAFDLDAYTEALKARELPSEARADLDSGNWLFGRGSMDMKAGLAVFLTSMEVWVHDADLPVNILFWAVPDEEANSAGMIGSLKAFHELAQREHLQIVAAFTGEPCFWQPETEHSKALRPYYLGSTGKLMPFIYALGKSVHVGNYFEGVNAALLLSAAVEQAEANLRLFEGSGLDLLAPPACLNMEVRRTSYSVTLPGEAVAYFNVLTTTKQVDEVIRSFCMVAAQASGRVRNKLEAARFYAVERGASCPEVPQINIFQYKLLKKMAEAKNKEHFAEDLAEFWQSMPKDIDAREAAIRECEWMIQRAQPPRPAMIVGLLPPYYPSRINRSEEENEIKLREVVEEAVEHANQLAGNGSVRMHEVFGGISDLSFLGFKTLRAQGEAAASNMAGWGQVFKLPTDIEREDQIPVANMGPAGKDAHRPTERLELHYSLTITPQLLSEAIAKLG